MNPHLTRTIRKILSPFRRANLRNTSFSILSNNCWGGVVYDIFGLQYRTPTIGLYFFSSDYIKFLSRIDYYLSLEARPITIQESRHRDELIKRKHCFIGIIDDVELIFVHYKNAEEGCLKWNKRRQRVNFNNLLVKFNDQNYFKIENFLEFQKLGYKNKLFITANKELKNDKSVLFLRQFEHNGYVVDDIKPSLKKLKIKTILNSLENEDIKNKKNTRQNKKENHLPL